MRVATHVALSSFGLLVISLNLTLWIALDMKSFYKNSLEIADEFKEIEAASWKKLREMSKLTNRWKRHSKPGSYAVSDFPCHFTSYSTETKKDY